MTLSVTLEMQIPYSNSLKDKRAILQSMIKKSRDKFNISIAETEKNDDIKAIVIEIAAVSNNDTHAKNQLDEVIRFIESNWEGDIAFMETYYN